MVKSRTKAKTKGKSKSKSRDDDKGKRHVIWFDTDLLEQVKNRASSTGTSQSQIICSAIRWGLEQPKVTPYEMPDQRDEVTDHLKGMLQRRQLPQRHYDILLTALSRYGPIHTAKRKANFYSPPGLLERVATMCPEGNRSKWINDCIRHYLQDGEPTMGA